MVQHQYSFLNCQAEVAAKTIFKRTLWEYLMTIPGKSTKLNIYLSVFVAKSPNLMSAECTTPMIFCVKSIIKSCINYCFAVSYHIVGKLSVMGLIQKSNKPVKHFCNFCIAQLAYVCIYRCNIFKMALGCMIFFESHCYRNNLFLFSFA